MDQAVGSVSRLWRYPVKSMAGEEVESANVVWSGFYGNRCYALVDQESSYLVSAKNPKKWGRAFECSSRLLGDGIPGPSGNGRQPPVRVVLPDGRDYELADGDYGAAETALSEFFGRKVRFVAAQAEPREFTSEQYHPEMEEDSQSGMTTQYVRPLSAQAGTFTDAAAVHIVTTASLRAFADLYPKGEFDVRRFRPNILVETREAAGLVEKGWVDRTLAVGDVRLKVLRETKRCVMTTLPQGGLPPDVGILRTVARHNGGRAGVFASVEKGGVVRKGDEVALL